MVLWTKCLLRHFNSLYLKYKIEIENVLLIKKVGIIGNRIKNNMCSITRSKSLIENYSLLDSLKNIPCVWLKIEETLTKN